MRRWGNRAAKFLGAEVAVLKIEPQVPGVNDVFESPVAYFAFVGIKHGRRYDDVSILRIAGATVEGPQESDEELRIALILDVSNDDWGVLAASRVPEQTGVPKGVIDVIPFSAHPSATSLSNDLGANSGQSARSISGVFRPLPWPVVRRHGLVRLVLARTAGFSRLLNYPNVELLNPRTGKATPKVFGQGEVRNDDYLAIRVRDVSYGGSHDGLIRSRMVNRSPDVLADRPKVSRNLKCSEAGLRADKNVMLLTSENELSPCGLFGRRSAFVPKRSSERQCWPAK